MMINPNSSKEGNKDLYPSDVTFTGDGSGPAEGGLFGFY